MDRADSTGLSVRGLRESVGQSVPLVIYFYFFSQQRLWRPVNFLTDLALRLAVAGSETSSRPAPLRVNVSTPSSAVIVRDRP